MRWLVAAPFSVPPTGRFTAASGERFQSLMSRLGPRATVEIPDGLGAGQTRRITLALGRPRDFRLTEVVKRIDVLARLCELADGVERSGATEPVLRKLEALVGKGALLDATKRVIDGEPAPDPVASPPPVAASPPSSPTPEQEGTTVDAIFGKADLAPTSGGGDVAAAAKSGLDAFVGAMRSGGKGDAKPATKSEDKALAKQVARLIRRAVDATALDVMASPAIATLESSWRGLRMVVSEAPGADDLALDMLDSDGNELVSRLRHRLDLPPMDRPDAVFVALSIASPEILRALAELGEERSVPIIVEVPDTATGARLGDDELPPVPETWAQLRELSATTWLFAASNAVVLANEEVGETHRVVFGSPVWGLAAMLSASVNQTGGPGQVFGRAGALVSPASYALDGSAQGQTIATQRLATVDQQRALAERGVLVLGSERGSDRLRLAAAPTVHAGGRHDLQLPGRILAGRAARFAKSIRDELPPHATDQEVAARITEASTNFLPRSPRGAVALTVRTDEDGKLGVEASIGAALAGTSFEFSSDL
ncbi:type VI secretion system contractile sheath large subunit [Paraliomyxa miuraensis]|uniref:type VI secretion system contractile sheath large subunit n=1 Tax=Paraliomyxa miuraensis TaxID=376150 RepID=UPI00224C9E4A|nr:type VI secretion system contractile sheath large subunit [Paraliomyxa miuraensis]MCX4246953.1 type VI secretion system contractile sheath large subunit [Paraliomyxa miuraensis]